ncbi:putative flippase GtrA [Stackebrandtia albiflava]|uniref:Putative flippase GtrA n=1 Tax=Stackebrandtia albiflava TaxID=406432 RepID=A0A562V4I8_9ACTN|nr:GtrA family protein [Stackebrandtia albiflava]TWJ12755.1 putative flippase GtrA [Stackebrandtia albiflava]
MTSRTTAWARWRERLPDLGREAARFAAVGSVAYLVDTGLFNLAHYAWHVHTVPAKLLSTVFAASLAFVGNRFWTWRDRERAALHREYLTYFAFNTVGLGLTLGVAVGYQVAVARWPEVLDNPLALNLVVNVLGVGLGTLFRFHAYRTWVFRRVRPESAPTR